MHLLILGLILVVGILVYYIMTTSPGKSGKSSSDKKIKIKTAEEENHVPEDLRKEDNVIFLPTADGTKPDGSSDSDEK